jgi:hypothetical protein
MTTRIALCLLACIAAAWSCTGAKPTGGGTTTTEVPSASGGTDDPHPQPPAGTTEGIACGKARCAAGEACCDFSDQQLCVPAVAAPAAAGEQLARWSEQGKRCATAAKTDFALTAMSTCDDSNDCAAKERCCGEALGSDVSLSSCATASCSYGEHCEDGTCRTPGTTCIDGRCMKGPAPHCAGAACTAAAPICCGPFAGGAPSCHDAAGCTFADLSARYDCTEPGDCPTGEVCQSSLSGTRCQSSFDFGNAQLVCTGDGDCTPDICFGNRSRCIPLKDLDRPWLSMKTCVCL